MGDEAMELFHMINPDQPHAHAEDVERYKAEPYAVAADVYAHPMHVGRGGWTWYTGSAGWMYRVNPCVVADLHDRVAIREHALHDRRREPRRPLRGRRHGRARRSPERAGRSAKSGGSALTCAPCASRA
jgi:hypothetical protein